MTISGGGTLTRAAIAADNINVAQPYALSDGILSGPGTVIVSGTLTWNGGTMSGTGVTQIASGGTLDYSGGSLSGRALNNAGTFNLTNTLNVSPTSTITNQANGLFDIKFDGNDSFAFTQPTFNNNLLGTVRKSVGTNPNNFNAAFSNNGVVDVTNGTLNLSGASGSSTGNFTVANNTTVRFSSAAFTFNAGTTITGAGTGLLSSGTVTIGAGATVTADKFTLSGTGILTGPGTFLVDAGDVFTWSGGTMSGAGITQIASGGTLDYSGGNLERPGLEQCRDVQPNEHAERQPARSTITNQAGGLFDIEFTAATASAPSTPTFNNNLLATVRKSVGTNPNNFNATFTIAAWWKCKRGRSISAAASGEQHGQLHGGQQHDRPV